MNGGAAIAAGQVLDLLTHLVEKSLVVYEEDEHGHGRYRLLETVRQYAWGRLRESGEGEAVRERHWNFFQRLADKTEPDLPGDEQAKWLERLETEHDNLRAALEWSIAADKEAAGLRLAHALSGFWQRRGYHTEAREWFARLLTREGATERTKERAAALHAAGSLALEQGDYGAARSLIEESLEIFRDLENRWGVADTLGSLGDIAYDQGDLDAAHGFREEHLALSRQLGNRYAMMRALSGLANVARVQYDVVSARVLFEESLAIGRELDHRVHIAWTLLALGNVASAEGDYGAARSYYAQNLRMFQEVGERAGVAFSLERFAALAATRAGEAQAQRAARLFGAAEALRQAVGTTLPPVDHSDYYDRAIAATRAALGDEVFSAAWAEGRAMTLEQAADYALGDGES